MDHGSKTRVHVLIKIRVSVSAPFHSQNSRPKKHSQYLFQGASRYLQVRLPSFFTRPHKLQAWSFGYWSFLPSLRENRTHRTLFWVEPSKRTDRSPTRTDRCSVYLSGFLDVLTCFASGRAVEERGRWGPLLKPFGNSGRGHRHGAMDGRAAVPLESLESSIYVSCEASSVS